MTGENKMKKNKVIDKDKCIAACKRDEFIGHLKNFRELLEEQCEEAFLVETLESIHRSYAAPDHDLPDFELAQFLKKLDDDFLGTSKQPANIFSLQISCESLLPAWARAYLREYSHPKNNDPYRREFLEKLYMKGSGGKEACFLLAAAFCQEACNEAINKRLDIAEKLFEESTKLFRTLYKTLPEPLVRIPIFRKATLFSQSPQDIMQDFEMWAIGNYIELLRELRKIDKAVDFISAHPNLQKSKDLMSLLRDLTLEKRIRDDVLLRELSMEKRIRDDILQGKLLSTLQQEHPKRSLKEIIKSWFKSRI